MNQLLDIDEMITENKKQESNRLGIFESLLSQCHSLIKRNNKDRIREMYYTIPTFVYGKPKYDVDILRNYLIHHLLDNGLYVKIVDRLHLYISWKEADINLSKYMHRKTLINNRHSSMYMIEEGPGGSNMGMSMGMGDRRRKEKERMEMLRFRQERQRQLQDERQDRFNFQKKRAPLPEMNFKDFIHRY